VTDFRGGDKPPTTATSATPVETKSSEPAAPAAKPPSTDSTTK